MRARAVASIVLAGALTLGMSGCVFITPTATLYEYDPGNGIGGRVGDVDIRDALALVNEDGTAVSLLVTFVNRSDQAVKVNVQFDSDGEKTTEDVLVPKNRSVQLGNTTEQDQLIIANPDTKAGALLPIYFQYGDNEGTTLLVPVLDGSLPEYADLVPAEGEE